MSLESNLPNESATPSQPTLTGAEVFSRQMDGLMDGQPKDVAPASKAVGGMDDAVELMAARLYSMASMLVGEGEQSVRLVEHAIANAEVSACHDLEEARKSGLRALVAAALDMLARRSPDSLTAPDGPEPVAACIEDDDLASAGISTAELERMIGGQERERVRNWLESLPTAQRTVFVLRAVAGFTTPETAALLRAHGGPRAAAWTPEGVRGVLRQGLCSLASQLLHATAER
ncbi:MAG: sigma factor-like helix-turn-helix DNA-binding protein [Terracidiphilus sp.]|jgi:DNA-directed RNA polymerase specialized sigma24 family protein